MKKKALFWSKVFLCSIGFRGAERSLAPLYCTITSAVFLLLARDLLPGRPGTLL
jgi:hypothetical protein